MLQNLNEDNTRKKIFVIDDDISIGDVITSLLTLEGYNVHSFAAGSKAIDAAKEKKADLVLLDYFLPGEKAENIIKDLRNLIGNDLPIILMSANDKGVQIAKSLPVNEFIPKPFQIDLLLETIKKNID